MKIYTQISIKKAGRPKKNKRGIFIKNFPKIIYTCIYKQVATVVSAGSATMGRETGLDVMVHVEVGSTLNVLELIYCLLRESGCVKSVLQLRWNDTYNVSTKRDLISHYMYNCIIKLT